MVNNHPQLRAGLFPGPLVPQLRYLPWAPACFITHASASWANFWPGVGIEVGPRFSRKVVDPKAAAAGLASEGLPLVCLVPPAHWLGQPLQAAPLCFCLRAGGQLGPRCPEEDLGSRQGPGHLLAGGAVRVGPSLCPLGGCPVQGGRVTGWPSPGSSGLLFSGAPCLLAPCLCPLDSAWQGPGDVSAGGGSCVSPGTGASVVTRPWHSRACLSVCLSVFPGKTCSWRKQSPTHYSRAL